MFKSLEGQNFDAAKVERYSEDLVLFVRVGIHPVLDGVNTGYNFALRGNPIDDTTGKPEQILEVSAGESGVKARLIGEVLSGWGNMDLPNPNYRPLPIIREIVLRMKKDGVVFFEEDHGHDGLCSFIATNIQRNPQMFIDAFGGAVVVLDDEFRPQDITVRFFPRL